MIAYGWVFIAFFVGVITGAGGLLLLGMHITAKERRQDVWRQP